MKAKKKPTLYAYRGMGENSTTVFISTSPEIDVFYGARYVEGRYSADGLWIRGHWVEKTGGRPRWASLQKAELELCVRGWRRAGMKPLKPGDLVKLVVKVAAVAKAKP